MSAETGRGPPSGDLKPFRDVAGKALVWRRPAPFGRTFELRAGGHLVARLAWPSRSSTEAQASTADAHWILRREGRLRERIAVLDGGTGELVVEARVPRLGAGTVQLGGAQLSWRRAGVLRRSRVLVDARGSRLLVAEPVPSLRRGRLDVVVHPPAYGLAELPPLLCFARYASWRPHRAPKPAPPPGGSG